MNGHYAAHVKNNAGWFKCNDSLIEPATLSSAVNRDNILFVFQRMEKTDTVLASFTPSEPKQKKPKNSENVEASPTKSPSNDQNDPVAAKTGAKKQNTPELQICKGCGQSFRQIKRHLSSKKGQLCSTKYATATINSEQPSADQSVHTTPPILTKRNIDRTENNLNESKLIVCKGCGKSFQKLLQHLSSVRGQSCKEFHTDIELQPPCKKKIFYERNKEQLKEKARLKYQKNKEQKKEKAKKHYQKNREQIKEKVKEHCQKNKEQMKEKKKEHYQKNKEQIKVKKKDYCQKNKEQIKVKRKEHYQKNKEQIKVKAKEHYQIKRKLLTMDQSIRLFRQDTIWGPIYPCISCHRFLFRSSVSIAKDDQLNKHSVFEKAVDPNIMKTNTIFAVKGQLWICSTCLSYIKRNKLPKLSAMNSLKVFDRPECLNLTEVENVLISPRISFMKIMKLPVTRMAGIKDRIINVPVPLEVIQETVETLPRTLEEASVVPVLLKRKKSYENNYLQQHIRPGYIRNAVEYLQNIYPPYKDFKFDFGKVLSETDHFEGDDNDEDDLITPTLTDDENDCEDDDEFDPVEDENEEDHYVKNDPVKSNQTEVSSSVFLLPENLESTISHTRNNDKTESFVFAPGEGQIPQSILREKDPFLLHYPILFPNGRWSLNDEEREVKITPQQFINQRIYNINPIFR